MNYAKSLSSMSAYCQCGWRLENVSLENDGEQYVYTAAAAHAKECTKTGVWLALPEKPDACWTCRFERNSECHRHAPLGRLVDNGGHWAERKWPTVMRDDWCGDYQRKESTVGAVAA